MMPTDGLFSHSASSVRSSLPLFTMSQLEKWIPSAGTSVACVMVSIRSLIRRFPIRAITIIMRIAVACTVLISVCSIASATASICSRPTVIHRVLDASPISFSPSLRSTISI